MIRVSRKISVTRTQSWRLYLARRRLSSRKRRSISATFAPPSSAMSLPLPRSSRATVSSLKFSKRWKAARRAWGPSITTRPGMEAKVLPPRSWSLASPPPLPMANGTPWARNFLCRKARSKPATCQPITQSGSQETMVPTISGRSSRSVAAKTRPSPLSAGSPTMSASFFSGPPRMRVWWKAML